MYFTWSLVSPARLAKNRKDHGGRDGRSALAGLRAKLLAVSSDKDVMISLLNRPKPGCRPLDYKQIENRLNGAPCLPSLASIEGALKELLSADQRYTTQIAEIIRRDPA